MTLEAERGASRPAVCPFVAFDDDRDHRAASPDHRHRCYAETPAAPRALAHQARYCLSPEFADCPIFQDWAAREAAQVDEEAGSGRVAPPAGAAAAAGAAGAVGGAGLFDALRASVPPSVPARPVNTFEAGPVGGDEEAADENDEGMAAAAPRRDWDRPARRRDYPRLERRRGVPTWVIGVVALAIVALLIFLAPRLLGGLFGGATGSPVASGTALASGGPPVASATPEGPTAAPSAAQLTYTIVSGDTLTKIAKKFNVTVQDILAANPIITNANNIKVGQVIVIPTAGASTSPAASP